MRPLRRIAAAVLTGEPRVWKLAALVALPFLAVLVYYCVKPRDYYTGTNNVESYSYVAEAHPGASVCVPNLEIPAATARIRLQLITQTRSRPALRMTLHLGTRTSVSAIGPTTAASNRVSAAVFAIPRLPARPSEQAASLCLAASALVNWGGTPLPSPPSSSPPTLGGKAIPGLIAVWYLPAAGVKSSYLARAGAILHRASLFRPRPVGPWLYLLMLLVGLPCLAFASVRCLALAVAAQGDRATEVAAQGDRATGAWSPRRAAAWLFAIAALNFACWAFITPPFQAPDEVDHFAYTQSLVQRGEAPSRDPASPLPRWSSAETLALEDSSFFSDHQVGDTKPPWTERQQTAYRVQVRARHPSSSDAGGNETAATHGALYYAALAPAYAAATSSPFSQLTLMRLTSALIGALTVVFAFLMARELAPGRPWPAVLAALLVAYQPMFGFISGAVNNDVGVNAAAAAVELLLFMMLKRGMTVRLGLLTGALLVVLPIVKGTGYALYPVAAIVLVATLYRHHRRADLPGWAGLVGAVVAIRALAAGLAHVFHPATAAASGGAAAPPEAGSVSASTSEALHHPIGYLGYLWQALLPRLPFMTDHFANTGFAGFVIYVERGWGAFGWYDVFFPNRVYVVIFAVMVAVPILGVLAIRREWEFARAHLIEMTVLVLFPLAVVAGVEAAFYTPGARAFVAEFGRYAFPAIAPLAVIVVASLHGFGRRLVLGAGVAMLVGMLALSFAAQLLTLSGFYA